MFAFYYEPSSNSRQMHRVAKLLVVFVAFNAVGCGRVSPSETRLIGEWSIPTGDIDDNGAYPNNRGFELTTFKADHTFSQISHHTDLPPAHVLSGSWHLEGQQLVLKFTWAHPSMQDMVGQELRLMISDVQLDHFISANTQNQKQKIPWTRVK